MNPLKTMKGWWTGHGTKILGALGVAAGGLATVDPASITAVLTAVLGERGPGIATVLLGAATIYRGVKNTRAANQQPAQPPQP